MFAFESEAEPVVAIAAGVLQQDGRKIILGDEQIDGAVAIEIESNHGARIVEHDFVEAGFGGDIAKAGWAFVSEQHDAAFA